LIRQDLHGIDKLWLAQDTNLIKNELLKSKLASFSAELIQGFEDEIGSMNLSNQLHGEFCFIVATERRR
jgi:hypothetical protein